MKAYVFTLTSSGEFRTIACLRLKGSTKDKIAKKAIVKLTGHRHACEGKLYGIRYFGNYAVKVK